MVISRRRFAENLKEMHGLKKARAGRAKLLFLAIKYAKNLERRRCSRVVDLKLPIMITDSREILAVHLEV